MEAASSQPDGREYVNRQNWTTYDQDVPPRAQLPLQNPGGQMRPSGPLRSRPSRSSRVAHDGDQAWPDFLRDHSEAPLMAEGWDLDPRATQPKVDRKRRLTSSTHDSRRVRTPSGGFRRRNQSIQSSYLDGSSSAPLPQNQGYETSIHGSSRASFGGRNLGGMNPFRHYSSDLRSPVSTTQEAILPRWQPDSEVTECPICSRQFTFWFRKHHCRKCGRVVCASCSPHRITIPRQFIVNPPDSTTRTSPGARSNFMMIDLNDESASLTRPGASPSWAHTRRTSNPGLGGGEEVRLCNPCVPDPQPSPQTARDLADFLRQGPVREEVRGSPELPQYFRPSHLDSEQATLDGQRSSSDEAREYCRQRRLGAMVCAI